MIHAHVDHALAIHTSQYTRCPREQALIGVPLTVPAVVAVVAGLV